MTQQARPSALLVSPEAPYPVRGGGAVRTASVLEYLGRRYELDLIAFRQPGAPHPAAVLPPGLIRQLQVIDLPYHAKSGLARLVRNLPRYLRGCPPLVDRFGGFGRTVSGFLRGRNYELAVIEHSWCAPYLEQVAPHARRMVLDLHNIESVLYDRWARTAGWPLSVALRGYCRASLEVERRWLPGFSLLLAASPEDSRAVRQIAPGPRCEVYPNTIPLAPQPVQPEENVVIFSGTFDYAPNISAVRFFRSEIWPLLRERWPELRWRLVGLNPEAVKKHVRRDPRIELRGPVEDAIGAIAAARVVVVPLLAGSGTRVKILEAWAAARAVVSTSLGAEGLPGRDGEHLLLADTPKAFAGAVSSLLESAQTRRRLGEAGRALYEKHFTWETAWAILERIGI